MGGNCDNPLPQRTVKQIYAVLPVTYLGAEEGIFILTTADLRDF